MARYEREIAANLERAEQSIQAAKERPASGFYDFAASCIFGKSNLFIQ